MSDAKFCPFSFRLITRKGCCHATVPSDESIWQTNGIKDTLRNTLPLQMGHLSIVHRTGCWKPSAWIIHT